MSDIEFLSDLACPVVARESLYSLRKNQFHGMEAMRNSMQAVCYARDDFRVLCWLDSGNQTHAVVTIHGILAILLYLRFVVGCCSWKLKYVLQIARNMHGLQLQMSILFPPKSRECV